MRKVAHVLAPDSEPLPGASARYPRTHRLLSAAHFQRVFKQNKTKASDRYLTVLAAPNQLNIPRLGTAISIKSAGNAVHRNRIKRLVRESFRLHQTVLSGSDYVVLARPGIAKQSNQRLLDALEKHWRTLTSHADIDSKTD